MNNFFKKFFGQKDITSSEEITVSDDLILDDVFNVNDDAALIAAAGDGMLANPNACRSAM